MIFCFTFTSSLWDLDGYVNVCIRIIFLETIDIRVTVNTLKRSTMDYITSQMSYTLSQLVKIVVSKTELNFYRNNK